VVVPAAAQATPHWFSNSLLLEETAGKPSEEETKTVIGWGTLKLKGESGSVTGSLITCHNATAGTAYNPVGGTAGKGEVQVFATFDCESTTCGIQHTNVIGEHLPWPQVVTEGGTTEVPFRVESKEIKVGIFCKKGAEPEERALGFGKGTGTNAPLGPAGTDKGTGALHPGFQSFDAGSGELEAESPFTGKSKTIGVVHTMGYAEQELLQLK
jgi:hypothetical protein